MTVETGANSAPVPYMNDTKTHWTTSLRTENGRLEAALEALIHDVRCVVESRFQKERDYPSDPDYRLGYVTCAQEIDLRVQEAINRARETAGGGG